MRHICDKRRHLDEVVESRAGCGERQLQVLENLSGLGDEIVFADNLAGVIEGNLSGDINGPAAVDFDHVRVARGNGQSWRIHISEICAAHSVSPLYALTALYVGGP